MGLFELEVNRFKECLKTGILPGLHSQLKMLPITRSIENINNKYPTESKRTIANTPKKSAVLILLYPKHGFTYLVMMVRALDNGVHSGQISFPGGKSEKSDPSLEYTALREANEEIGIIHDTVEIIGKLTNIFIPPSNFDVYPFVGVSLSTPIFKPNNEVHKLLEIKLSTLQNPKTKGYKKIKHRSGNEFLVPCYYVDGEVIWGASAMMLSEFLDLY